MLWREFEIERNGLAKTLRDLSSEASSECNLTDSQKRLFAARAQGEGHVGRI